MLTSMCLNQIEKSVLRNGPGRQVSILPKQFTGKLETETPTCLVLLSASSATSPALPSKTFSVRASLLLSQRSKKQYLLRLCAFTPNKSLFQMSALPHSALPFCRWLERIKRFWWSRKWPSPCFVFGNSCVWYMWWRVCAPCCGVKIKYFNL